MEAINYDTLTKQEYVRLFEGKDFERLYDELSERVKAKKLNAKIPVRGTVELIIVLSLLGLSYYSLFHFHYAVTALLFILTFWRSTFVAHDVIHFQYYENKALNKNLGYLFGNVIIGASRNWWERDHNVEHHTWTNSAERDEDIKALGGIFTREKTGYAFVHRFKRFIFWMVLPLTWFSFHYQTWEYIFTRNFRWPDPVTILIHYAAIPGMFFYALPVDQALGALAILYVGYGTLAASVFITNHLGMEVLEGDGYKKMPWFEIQTRTSRNITGGPLVHWIYGGLNTQIEHHLFPKIPRLKLLEVAKITEDFCREHQLFYYTVPPFKAYQEIHRELCDKGRFN